MSALSSKLEAILYLKGQPLSAGQLAEYAGCDRATLRDGLMALMDEYAHRDSALEVVETPDGYCLQLRPAFQDLVQTLLPVDLGLGALRTLAAIALKAPLTLTELVELRGSGAYQHVQELVELGFVKKRRKADSRSASLQVTDRFYQYFEVDKLPKISIKAKKSAPIDQPDGLPDDQEENEPESD